MLILSLIVFGLTGFVSRYLVGSKTQVILLLSAGFISLLSPLSLVICLLIALVNYFFIQRAAKKSILIASIVFNVLAMGSFHVYSLLFEEFSWAGLPSLYGISYLALQYIGSTITLHYNSMPWKPGLINFFSSVFYLPKFFSGPIVDLQKVHHQMITLQGHSQAAVTGMNRMLLGAFKKLVLAGSLSPSVHSVLDFGDNYPGLTVLCAALLFSLQLYFDFSGYSDLAIGASQIWGIEIPENFKFPFRQKNWGDFWKSWHSSLTAWLWQFIFNPLFLFFSRHNLNKNFNRLLCALLVFTGMAFFNGFKSGFFISGGLFALFYMAETWLPGSNKKMGSIPLFLLFSLALLYFRCPDETQWKHLQESFAHLVPKDWLTDLFAPLASGGTQQDYFYFLTGLGLCLIYLLFERKLQAFYFRSSLNFTLWFVTILLILVWGGFDSGERFIYMQF